MKTENAALARCYAEIDLSLLAENLTALSEKIPPSTLKMAVVKANAYGHGALPVARFLAGRVDFFGVATAEEARELRRGGIEKPILILSFVAPEDYPDMVRLGVSLAVADGREAREISLVARALGRTAKIHIPTDTGMGRIGLSPDGEGADRVKGIADLDGVFLEGVFSHYATADLRDKAEAMAQTTRFRRFLALLRERGVSPPIAHISNSAATAELDAPFDMCRLGIALYGVYPSAECDGSALHLCPVMSLYSRVIQARWLPGGYKIGYGHEYTTVGRTLVATVSAGYADGYPSFMGGVGRVLIRGVSLPVIGRVCMDQMMVDATPLGSLSVGERVTLIGRECGRGVTVGEIAALTEAHRYELLCRISPRVRRFYINV